MIAEVRTMKAAEYHRDLLFDRPSLTASTARTLLSQSPAHAWTNHPRLNPDYQPTVAEKFDLGTVVHSLLLEGEAAVAIVDAPDWRTADAKTARDDARENGQIPLLLHNWAAVEQMVESVKAQLGCLNVDPPLFADGLPEQTLTWETDGVACRARLDWLRDDRTAIDDLKTTSRSANPETFSRTVFSMGYDVQAAFYLRGLAAVFGAAVAGMAEFRFVVCETAPPYALSVIGLSPAALELADAKVDWAVKTWRECLAADDWPAYPLRVCYADPPGWAETQWLEFEGRNQEVAA